MAPRSKLACHHQHLHCQQSPTHGVAASWLLHPMHRVHAAPGPLGRPIWVSVLTFQKPAALHLQLLKAATLQHQALATQPPGACICQGLTPLPGLCLTGLLLDIGGRCNTRWETFVVSCMLMLLSGLLYKTVATGQSVGKYLC